MDVGLSLGAKLPGATLRIFADELCWLEEGYDYFKDQIQPVPYPSFEAMQAVVAQIGETNPKARQVDAKSYINDRYLKKLEEEGFVKRLWGR